MPLFRSTVRSTRLQSVLLILGVGTLIVPAPAQSSTAATVRVITLDEALHLAEANAPAFAAAVAESRALALERTNARAALLPTVIAHNQVVYTQPNGTDSRIGQTIGAPTPLFIANNSIREYVAQGVATETIGFQQIAGIRLADANAARAAAEAEIARRGLVVSVVNLFYSIGNQQTREAAAQRALAEADRFLHLTQEREAGREVAHADTIKAQLQQQQRTRQAADAALALQKARLELAVLLFPDPATPFQTAPASIPPPLPERTAIDNAARLKNPEIASALASVGVAEAGTYAARAAFAPDIVVSAYYGIDAPQFAVNGPGGVRNLGYAGLVTLDIPVWDWLTTQRKLKESRLRRDAARINLTAAQRRLLADLDEFYAEAALAQQQLASLDQSVLTARESLRLTNLRYTNGESTVLEVVDAQNTLIISETDQSDGLVRYQLALAQLQTLTGRL